MPRERTKRYEEMGISEFRYRELKNIALQYDEMVENEKRLRRGEVDRKGKGNVAWKKPDPTGNTAISIAVRSNAEKIRAIEEAARAAGPGMYRSIMRNVTQGERYSTMVPKPPCGQPQFYRARQLFFVELDRRLP